MTRAAQIAKARATEPVDGAVMVVRLLDAECYAQAATVIRLLEVALIAEGYTQQTAREAVDMDILEARWVG